MNKPSTRGSNIYLQEATVSDIPVLIEVEKSVADANTYSPTLEQGEWEEELRNGKVFLVKKGDEVVGDASYWPEDMPAPFQGEGEGCYYLSVLAIVPKFRGRGIGRAAAVLLAEKLKNLNAKKLWLNVHPDNVRAVKMYKSFGFKTVARKENYYGDGEPRLIMSLDAGMMVKLKFNIVLYCGRLFGFW